MEFTILLLCLLLAGTWLWLDTVSVRERASGHAQRLCRELGVQFLDQTVALQRTRIAIAIGGGLTWRRNFHFEFSETGRERLRGEVEMLGQQATLAVLNGAAIGRIVTQATPPG